MKLPVTQTNGSVIPFTEETNNDMKTAYSYTRFSSLEQKKGESARRQVEAAVKWAKENGYTLSPDHFLDEGKSAFKGKHIEGEGDLKRFLALVENGKIRPGSALILESFDRFSRLPMVKAVTLFLNVINSGIGMVFTMTHGQKLITEKAINNEPYIIYSILGEAQRAHSESQHKSERISDACRKRNERAKAGEQIFKWTPPWCDFDTEKGYLKNEGRAAIVRRVFDEYLKGNGPYRLSRIFNGLTGQPKVPTMGRWTNGKNGPVLKSNPEWYKKVVRDLLLDRRVYGFAHHLNKENYYPSIVSKDIFNKVQNRLSLRADAKPTGGPIQNVGNLFTSIARCSECGAVIAKGSSRKHYKGKVTKYDYLVCDNALSGRSCSYKSVPYQFIEDTFFQVIDNDNFYGAMTKTDNSAVERLEIIEGEMVSNEKQIQKYRKLILNDDNPSREMVNDLKQFEGKRAQLIKTLQRAKGEAEIVSNIPAEAMELKNELNEKRKDPAFRLRVREYIRNVVDSITLNLTSEYKNYQVNFKSGFICSVVLWKNGKEEKDGVSFQLFPGVRREPDFNKGTIYGS